MRTRPRAQHLASDPWGRARREHAGWRGPWAGQTRGSRPSRSFGWMACPPARSPSSWAGSPAGRGLGSKVEVKNLNSFKFVRKAISFEIERQTEILERGGSVTTETRLWNENRDVTESMRTKESSSDYRYFPEPDLPPFAPDQEFLRRVEESLVELPEPRTRRLIDSFGLSEEQADFLCDEKSTADYFEETVRLGADAKSAALWLASDVKKHLNRDVPDAGGEPADAAQVRRAALPPGGKAHTRKDSQVCAGSRFCGQQGSPGRSSGKRDGSRSLTRRSWAPTSKRSCRPILLRLPRSGRGTIGPRHS